MSQSSRQIGRWVNRVVRWISSALVASTVLFTPLTHAQDKVTSSRIEALADQYDLPNLPVSPGQSRIVFYRPTQTSAKGAASVYINGRYHASLVPGGFSPVCIHSGPARLGCTKDCPKAWMRLSL